MTAHALVTGGAGFVGQWLARALLARGYEVTSFSEVSEPTVPVLDAAEHAAVQWLAGDVRAAEPFRGLVARLRPSVVFHLAGVSSVPSAQDAPLLAYEVNVLGAARLVTELVNARAAGVADPRVVVVGSAEQYGRHDAAALPLTEDAEQRPLTIYAASKVAQEHVALQAARATGLHVVATRSFNHSGPGQRRHFLLPALVQRALSLPADGGTLPIGNGAPIRDYTHVADVVEAYCRLAETGAPATVYNVCSGDGITVHALAERVLQRANRRAEIVVDPALVRPVDVPALVGSPARLRAATGWVPTCTLDDIIDDLIRTASPAHAPS